MQASLFGYQLKPDGSNNQNQQAREVETNIQVQEKRRENKKRRQAGERGGDGGKD